MEKKQRILIVHNYYQIPGGEDTVVSNEKEMLETHGHEVFLYSRCNSELKEMSKFQKMLLPFSAIFNTRTYREVRRLIRERNIDVVHVHNTLTLISPSVYYAAFSLGVPVVQTIHNFRLLCPAATFLRDGSICEECVEHGLQRSVKYACYRGSKLQTLLSAATLKIHRILGTYGKLFYICLTEFNKQKLLLLNDAGKTRIPESRIFVKPNFVRRPLKQYERKKERYIYVGRLDSLKGIKVLLEAWREFSDRSLLLCGQGPEEAWAKAYIRDHEMEQVRLLGYRSHEETMELIAESKALLMPTLWYEGQPMVILESYAVGTPVIASDVGNAGAMVVPEVTGICFRTQDPEALRKAVRRLDEIGEWNTKSIYEEQYSPEKNYQRLMEIYSAIQEGNI